MASPILQVYRQLSVRNEPQPLFINRDLSLVEFYRRVLDEALDTTQPPLERLRFLGIFSSLIDEFYMVRMSGLLDKANRRIEVSADGTNPGQRLRSIHAAFREMSLAQLSCLNNDVLPRLSDAGINVLSFGVLTNEQKDELRLYFTNEIAPILTPQAVDPSHPFPYISGDTLNLGLYICPKLTERIARELKLKADGLFVRIRLPSFLPRLIAVPGETESFILLENLVESNIHNLIPDADPAACHPFRITRDADIELRNSDADDLLEMIEQKLIMRRFGDVVRLEAAESMPGKMIDYLKQELELNDDDIYRVHGPIKINELSMLAKLNRPELKFPPSRPITPEVFRSGKSTFDIIRKGDILLHHPYMPYSIISDFIAEAAEDPNVLAIKMCLYRLGAESLIPPLLISASERGKQVTVLIELKARFDEDNNIKWAKKLEEAGVHVIYGLLGLKTHAKNTLIVRREGGQLRRYVHAATGNYNPQTSAAYTDLGLLTADEQIGKDVSKLFNFLTVYARPNGFDKLLIAPHNLRSRMLELIGRETLNAAKGMPSRIIAKLNRLADSEIINALYEASSAGVQIDLIVRGICTLRPGISGISENIRVRSIVGRFLEHSRVYYFENGGDYQIYMGSSDWMPRNLDRRVEVLTPVESPSIKQYLKVKYLGSYLRDNVEARILCSDGTYQRAVRKNGDAPFKCQSAFQGDLGLFPHSGLDTEKEFFSSPD